MLIHEMALLDVQVGVWCARSATIITGPPPFSGTISSLRHVPDILTTILTLRRLMSYIYMEHPFLMFLDHTQRRSTVGRTPLDE